MRKLIISMNITLDGFMSGPDCGLDWHFKCWTEEMGDALCRQLLQADTILLGRITFNAMAAYWPSKLSDSSCKGVDFAFSNMMNSYTKIVFSNTQEVTKWDNSILADSWPELAVTNLKKQPGKNIIIYGSGELIASLMQKNLIDELHLFIHPVILGQGNPFFRTPVPAVGLRMMGKKVFKSGVVLMKYKVVK